CNKPCQSCLEDHTGLAADGTCGFVTAGADPRDDCPDDGVASCDRDGSCDGAGACRRYAKDTVCLPTDCVGDTPTKHLCDGSGACNSAPDLACVLVKCANGACPTTCAGDDDCQADAYCDGATSACVAK